jgi:hypothetical protein
MERLGGEGDHVGLAPTLRISESFRFLLVMWLVPALSSFLIQGHRVV